MSDRRVLMPEEMRELSPGVAALGKAMLELASGAGRCSCAHAPCVHDLAGKVVTLTIRVEVAEKKLAETVGRL